MIRITVIASVQTETHFKANRFYSNKASVEIASMDDLSAVELNNSLSLCSLIRRFCRAETTANNIGGRAIARPLITVLF